MPRRRPHTDGLPSLLNGNMMLEYKRYQKLSKSAGGYTVRERVIQEEFQQKGKVSNFGDPCAFHKETLDFYCHTHKEPACIVCATTMHKVCHVVTVNENAVKSSQACVSIEDIERTIETVLENIEKIKLDREENSSKLLLQKHAIEKELHNIRKKMNERLDHIEKEITGQLNENYRRYKYEMDHLVKDLDHRKQGVQSLHNSLMKAKNKETDVEAFLEEKKIEKKVHHEEKYVTSFYNDESLKQVDFEFKLNPIINSFIVDIKSFGDVITRKSPSRVNLTRIVHKQNAPEVLHLNRHISHIKLRLHEKTYNSTGIQDIRALPHIYGTLHRETTM